MPPFTANWLIYATIFLWLLLLLVYFRKPITRALQKLVFAILGLLGLLTEKTSDVLQKASQWLLKPLPKEGDDLYEDLTPKDNADPDKQYDKKLKWGLENPNVKNIAVTGPYGSGKSSILKTFRKQHREYRYLNLSLASFKVNENLDKETEVQVEQLVEFSILQQIILHINHNRLPGSRFHRIHHQARWKSLLTALLLTTLCLALLFVFQNDFYKKFIENIKWSKDSESVWASVYSDVIVLGAFFLFYFILRIYTNSTISKVSIPSAEVEITPKDVSVLNKQIEEILYFFEVTPYNVVIIEDLDRFKNPQIFTKLREINTFINNAEQVKRKVVFVYVLGDDMFEGEKRTKFFDFIIPVIPVVNASNSLELLKARVKKVNLEEKDLPESFLSDISLYIDDMRLLINIMNEFNLYRTKLKQESRDLDDKKLFAIVVYKNIYPADFAEMHCGNGLVVNTFKARPLFVEKSTAALKVRNKEIIEIIRIADEAIVQDVKELRAVYIGKLFELITTPDVTRLQIEGVRLNAAQLNNDKSFTTLKTLKTITFEHLHSPTTRVTASNFDVSFIEVEKAVNPKYTYGQREEAIRFKQQNQIEGLKLELEKNKREINRLQALPLQSLLNIIPLEEYRPELNAMPLLGFLLRNGYIDEQYPYYISYFYPGTLQDSDLDFILSIKDLKKRPYEHKLTNVAAIMPKLRVLDFEKTEILNFDMLDYLLINKDAYPVELAAMMHILNNGTQASKEFADLYIIGTNQTESFIKIYSSYRKDWWDYLHEHPTITGDTRTNVFLHILNYAGIADIKRMNSKGNVSAFLSQMQSFGIDKERLQALLLELDVKVESVTDEATTSELMDYLYANNLYAINIDMLRKVFLAKSTQQQKEAAKQFEEANYSAIGNSGLVTMIEYVQSNADLYIEKVYLALPTNSKDPLDAVLEMLENENIKDETKMAIISKVEAKIESLEEVDEVLQGTIVRENKMAPNWKNLLVYYKYAGEVDEGLMAFVNNLENTEILEGDDPDDDVEALDENGVPIVAEEEEQMGEMIQEIMTSPQLSDQAFEKLAPVVRYEFEDVPFAKLNPDRITGLIDNNLLVFNSGNIDSLRKTDVIHALYFIESNMEEYLKYEGSINLTPSEYIKLLESKDMKPVHKLAVVAKINPDFFDKSTELATTAAEAMQDVDPDVPFTTLLKIVENSSDEEVRIKIAMRQMKAEDHSLITELLAIMGDTYAEIRIRGKRPVISDTPINRAFAEKLKSIAYISSYSPTERGLQINTFRGDGGE